MGWSEQSKSHYKFIRSLPKEHTESGLDYNISIAGNVLYLAFDETIDADDWAADFDFFPKVFDIYTGVKAHGGIARQYLSIRNLLMDHLYNGKIKSIYIAGFSLGGALTTLAVQDIGYHIDRDNLDVSVFGISYDGPRVFGPSRIVSSAVADRLITVKAHCDPVVYLPFKVMLTFFTLRWKPIKVKFCCPRISLWKDYGKIVWIGKPWRLWPVQHKPAQIERALEEKYGD